MARAGVVVLWSNDRPMLELHPLGPAGLELGRHLVEHGTDDRISKRHARVELAPMGLVVTDLGSRNGTTIEESRQITEATPIPPSSLIRCGRSLFLAVEDLTPYEGRAIVERHRLVVGATLHEPCNQLDAAILAEANITIVGPRWVARTLARAYLAARGPLPESGDLGLPFDHAVGFGTPPRVVFLEQPARLDRAQLAIIQELLDIDARFVTCVRREAELDSLPRELARWLAPATIRITEPRYDELPSVVHAAVTRVNLPVQVHCSAISELLVAARTGDEDFLLDRFGRRLHGAHASGRSVLRAGQGSMPTPSRARRTLREVHVARAEWWDP